MNKDFWGGMFDFNGDGRITWNEEMLRLFLSVSKNCVIPTPARWCGNDTKEEHPNTASLNARPITVSLL